MLSGASSAETSLNVGAAAPGLFDSFNRVEEVEETEKPKARAKTKTKSSLKSNGRLKSTKLSVQREPVTPKLSETLQVHNYVKFEHQVFFYFNLLAMFHLLKTLMS